MGQEQSTNQPTDTQQEESSRQASGSETQQRPDGVTESGQYAGSIQRQYDIIPGFKQPEDGRPGGGVVSKRPEGKTSKAWSPSGFSVGDKVWLKTDEAKLPYTVKKSEKDIYRMEWYTLEAANGSRYPHKIRFSDLDYFRES